MIQVISEINYHRINQQISVEIKKNDTPKVADWNGPILQFVGNI